jgi:hypothetical protein
MPPYYRMLGIVLKQCGMNYVCNLSIFIFISPRDIVGINKLILILKIISQTLCDAADKNKNV